MIAIIFVGILGILILIWGIRLRLGYHKAAYLYKGIPVYQPRASIFVNIPLGILLTSIGLTGFFSVELGNLIFDFTVIPLMIFTIVLAFWQPNWLLPDWLSFLRQTYGEGMTDAMLAEASKDIPAWVKQVETHEGLVAWADKTSRELRFPHHHEANPP